MSQGNGKDGVPKASELNQLNDRKKTNFVKNNFKQAAFDMKPPLQANKEEVKKPQNYGKVPQYLNKFHKERDDEMKRRAMEEEMLKHPPGTRLMPEDERVATLQDLS